MRGYLIIIACNLGVIHSTHHFHKHTKHIGGGSKPGVHFQEPCHLTKKYYMLFWGGRGSSKAYASYTENGKCYG